MTNKDVFAQASRKKVRFEVTISKRKVNAVISSEELWDLSLEDLNTAAIACYNQLQASAVSFIGEPVESDTLAQLKLDVIKYIIAVKKEEAQLAKTRAEKAVKKQLLAQHIFDKQNQALSSKSLEELQAELDSL